MNDSPIRPTAPSGAEPTRVLMLMTTAGGGHKSAALSLEQALISRYGDSVVIDTVDVLKEYAPQPFDRMPEVYQMMIKTPVAWKSFYEIGDGVRRSKVINSSIAVYARRHSERLLDNHPADIIVSTYFIANSPILETLRRRHLNTPYVTVVTDLVSAPPLWFDKRTTLCICPTPEVAELAIKGGLAPNIIKVIGMPVSSRFSPATESKTKLKAALGWDTNRPAILAMAGAEGIGSLEQIAEVLTTLNVTVALVTGKNTNLFHKLSTSDTSSNLKIYGFVPNINELMQAADLIVTKAGAATVIEALNTHLPLLIYARLHGQEEGNITFVTDNHAGIWQPKIPELAATIQDLLDSPNGLEDMAAAAAAISQPHANDKIAAAIGELIER